MNFKQVAMVLAATAAAVSGADTLKLMFGPESAPESQRKFAGFEYVTPASPVWSGSDPVPAGWSYQPNGGAVFKNDSAGSVPADVLLEHGMACRKDARLRIPFVGEKAKVHVFVGDWFLGWRRFNNGQDRDTVVELSCNGRKIFGTALTPANGYREWCKLEEYSFSRKDPIWDRIVKPVLDEYSFDAVPKDGVIELDLRHILLTAVIIASTEEEMSAALAETEAARRAMFAERYPWKPQPDEPMPENVDPAEDCVLFQKGGEDDVKPWTRPKAEEVRDVIRIWAARGEQEPFRFGVLLQNDFPDLFVEVGDFTGPGGAVMKTADVADFWRERYKERGSEWTRGKIDQLWRLDPLSYVMQKNAPQCGEAGTPRMYLLDVRVPEDAAAGDWFAPLTVKAGGKIVKRGRLQLRVMDFALRYDGAAQYGFQPMHGNSTMSMPGATREEILAGMKGIIDMIRKYRFHNIALQGWGWGFESCLSLGTIIGDPGSRHFSITPEQEKAWDWWFDAVGGTRELSYVMLQPAYILQNMGWRCVPLTARRKFSDPNWFTPEMQEQCRIEREDLVTVLGEIDRFLRGKGYPTPHWYMCGEIDNYGKVGAEECSKLGEVGKRAGIITNCKINGPFGYRLAPPAFDHVWANPASPIDEKLKATIESYGHGFGTHNCGDRRFQCGFQFWRTGSEGRYQETQFYTDFMRPYCLLPWNYNTAQAYPSPDGTYRPSLPWINYRDGRDDYLYLYTLEKSIAAAPKESAARREAEKFLAMFREKVKFDPRVYHKAKFDGIEATADIKYGEWNAVSLERYRWTIACHILNLGKAR